jgi:hypothetical protein
MPLSGLWSKDKTSKSKSIETLAALDNDDDDKYFNNLYHQKSDDFDQVQGCQMVFFRTKYTDFGKFWRTLKWKVLVFLCPFEMVYAHLVYFIAIWYVY